MTQTVLEDVSVGNDILLGAAANEQPEIVISEHSTGFGSNQSGESRAWTSSGNID